MKKTIEVTVGEKVTDATGNADAGKTHPKPEPASEVAGHLKNSSRGAVECPYCMTIMWTYEDTEIIKRFRCHACGEVFLCH